MVYNENIQCTWSVLHKNPETKWIQIFIRIMANLFDVNKAKDKMIIEHLPHCMNGKKNRNTKPGILSYRWWCPFNSTAF